MMHYHTHVLKQRRMGTYVGLLTTAVMFLAALPVQSQDKKQTGTGADQEVIKINSNLISLDVIVKDKKGKAITDLKPEDFIVSENGVPQKIEFFDSTLTSVNESSQPTSATVSTQPKQRAPTSFPRNIIALVLDGQSTELANLKHVREG